MQIIENLKLGFELIDSDLKNIINAKKARYLKFLREDIGILHDSVEPGRPVFRGFPLKDGKHDHKSRRQKTLYDPSVKIIRDCPGYW